MSSHHGESQYYEFKRLAEELPNLQKASTQRWNDYYHCLEKSNSRENIECKKLKEFYDISQKEEDRTYDKMVELKMSEYRQ